MHTISTPRQPATDASATFPPVGHDAAATLGDVSVGEFTTWFDQFRTGMSAEVTGAVVATVGARTETLVRGVVGEANARLEQRMDQLHQQSQQDIVQVRDRMAVHDREIQDTNRQLAEMQRRLDELQVGGPMVPDPTYDRPPDWSLLKLNTSSPCARSMVIAVVTDWLSPEFSADQWKLSGNDGDIAQHWDLNFVGVSTVAARNATKARNLNRLPNRQWRKLFVQAPDGPPQQLYINVDQSPKQQRISIAAKRLQSAIVAIHPEFNGHLQRTNPTRHQGRKMQSMLSARSVPLVGVTADDPDADVQLVWNPAALSQPIGGIAIKKADIIATFKELFTARQQVDTTGWQP